MLGLSSRGSAVPLSRGTWDAWRTALPRGGWAMPPARSLDSHLDDFSFVQPLLITHSVHPGLGAEDE